MLRSRPRGERVTQKPLVRHPEAVSLVVLDGDRVVLVRQPRPGAPGTTLELPAETFEPGETAREAAARGLAEECGLVAAGEWTEVGAFWAAPSYSTERVHVLCARVGGTTARRLDDDEEIEVERRPLDELPAALDDATSIAAFALWRLAGSP